MLGSSLFDISLELKSDSCFDGVASPDEAFSSDFLFSFFSFFLFSFLSFFSCADISFVILKSEMTHTLLLRFDQGKLPILL